MRSKLFALTGSFSLVVSVGCARVQPPAAAAPAASQAACAAGAFNAAAVEKEAAPATVLIATGRGIGSGFLIQDGREQLVVTNFHVAAGGNEIAGQVTQADGRQLTVGMQVVSVDRERDLALLRPNTPLAAQTLELSAEPPGLGDNIAIVGYPGVAGSNPVLTLEPGTVTAAQRKLGFMEYIQTNANVNPGNSGGPMIDGCGRVVGVVAARHLTTERLGLVIPTQAVTALLAQYHQPAPPPKQAAEKQLQQLFTEIKFGRSDKAANYFTRSYVEKTVVPVIDSLNSQARGKVKTAFDGLRKRRKDPEKLSQAEVDKLFSSILSTDEMRSLTLIDDVVKKRRSGLDAATQFLSQTAADTFGDLEDIWLESSSVTQSGCIDAYVTVSSAASTRRYVVHLHNQWSEWLVDSVKRAR